MPAIVGLLYLGVGVLRSSRLSVNELWNNNAAGIDEVGLLMCIYRVKS